MTEVEWINCTHRKPCWAYRIARLLRVAGVQLPNLPLYRVSIVPSDNWTGKQHFLSRQSIQRRLSGTSAALAAYTISSTALQ